MIDPCFKPQGNVEHISTINKQVLPSVYSLLTPYTTIMHTAYSIGKEFKRKTKKKLRMTANLHLLCLQPLLDVYPEPIQSLQHDICI